MQAPTEVGEGASLVSRADTAHDEPVPAGGESELRSKKMDNLVLHGTFSLVGAEIRKREEAGGTGAILDLKSRAGITKRKLSVLTKNESECMAWLATLQSTVALLKSLGVTKTRKAVEEELESNLFFAADPTKKWREAK